MNSAHLPKGFRVNLLHLAVLVAIVLVFSGLILWMSRVPKSLIHLRESKFENPRRKRNQEALKFGNRIETHPIIIIKSEKNDDLIEVFFKPGSQQDIFGQSKGHVQLPYTIKATVPVPGGRIRLFFKRMYAIMLSHVTPLPENRKLVRFIKWAPFSFLRSAAQPFKTQYHSLRVIIGRSFQLDGIKAKDLGGLLLIETCLSRGKLANDLQNFPINVSEFTYRLFLDPQELILGECRSRPYTLDVSVVEEPFEGFVLLREFALNFSIMEVPPSLENIGSEK